MNDKELIERAKSISGSYASVARALGIDRQRLNSIKNGTGTANKLSPEEVALIADLLSKDPADALIRATLEKHKGTEKGARLEAALGKSRRAIGEAASWLLSVLAGASLVATLGGLPTAAKAGTANRADVSTVRRLLALIMRSVNSAPRLLHRRYHRTAIGTA